MLEFELEELRVPKSLFDVMPDEENDLRFEAMRPAKSLFDAGTEIAATVADETDLAEQPKKQEKKGFWNRQFEPKVTGLQRAFDWAFGVVLPVICFAADPIVFKDWGGREAGLLGVYAPFAYVLSGLSIASMIVWLTCGKRLGIANVALSGLFAVGSIISLIIGLLLFPYSLLGLIVLIGVLGFTPIITSIIYLRNSYRAFCLAGDKIPRRLTLHVFVLTALFSVVVPYVANVQLGSWKNPARFIREMYYGPRF